MQEPIEGIQVCAQDAESTAQIRLAGEVDVRCAASLRAAALEVFSFGKTVRVDCSKVQYLDLSALQILLALRQELRNRAMDLEIENLQPSVRTVIQLAGLAEELLPAVTAS